MCDLVRDPQSRAEPAGATPPSDLPRARPRLAGALAMALLGGVALAAYVTPPAAAPQPAAGATPTTSLPVTTGDAAQVRSDGGAQRPVVLPDDEIPSGQASTKAAYGPCHHGT